MDGSYIKPPRTMMEVYKSLPEGTWIQLINNQLYLSPTPGNSHQKVLGKLIVQFGIFVERSNAGKFILGPFDAYLNKKNAFQPDIIFIANENVDKLREDGFYGAPDLVIEILSPATWRFDKKDKKDVYEQGGVKEYWMIDPADKSTEGFHLSGTEFEPLPNEKGHMHLRLLNLSLSF